MPAARRIESYPWEAYATLFRHVATTRERVIVPCAGKLRPLSLRGELYAFRRACRADPAGCGVRGIDAGAMEDVVVRVLGDGVEVLHREDVAGSQAVLEALATAGVEIKGAGTAPGLAGDAGTSLAKVRALLSDEPVEPEVKD